MINAGMISTNGNILQDVGGMLSKVFDLHPHPVSGFLYRTKQEPGALPIGTRVVRVPDTTEHKEDMIPVGTTGIIVGCLGSLTDQEMKMAMRKGLVAEDQHAYFVEWDTLPNIPVGVTGSDIREIKWTN